MKRIITLIMLFAMLSIAGCGEKEARIYDTPPTETISGEAAPKSEDRAPDIAKPRTKTYTEMGTHDELAGDRLKCKMSAAEIESYVKNYADPIWQGIEANIDSYVRLELRYSTSWSDSLGDVKRAFRRGSNGKDLEREYYYDPETGILVYAYLHARDESYKIYFDRGQVVRFTGSNGVKIDAPTDERIFEMANFVIWEAY